MVQNLENIDFCTFFCCNFTKWSLLKKNCAFWDPLNISDHIYTILCPKLLYFFKKMYKGFKNKAQGCSTPLSSWPIKTKIKARGSCIDLELTTQGILKRESSLFLTPVLTLWGGGHIDHHVWRWVIVPWGLAWSFSAICTQYCYRVIHHAITYVCVI